MGAYREKVRGEKRMGGIFGPWRRKAVAYLKGRGTGRRNLSVS